MSPHMLMFQVLLLQNYIEMCQINPAHVLKLQILRTHLF